MYFFKEAASRNPAIVPRADFSRGAWHVLNGSTRNPLETAMLSRSRAAATLPFQGLKAAKAFYSKKLGLKLTAGSVKQGFLQFATGSGTEILLFESESRKSRDTAATFEVTNLAKEMAGLRKNKVAFEKYDLPGIKTVKGVATMGRHKMAWVKDPGGNILALHQSIAGRTSI